MKTILFATDFSESSDKASLVAVQIAAQLNARLVLFNAYQPWLLRPGFPAKGDLNPERQRTESLRKLALLRRKLAQASNAKILAEVVAKEGLILDVLQESVVENNVDLLIMSTVGETPQASRLFGSLTTAMIARATVPMLLIPPTSTKTQFKQLALAIDLSKPAETMALDNVIRFAQAFEATVDMVCVTKEPDRLEIRKAAEQMRDFFRLVPHTMSLIHSDQLTDTLQAFLVENRTDLLVMLPQSHSWFELLFSETVTQRMARKVDVPILAVV